MKSVERGWPVRRVRQGGTATPAAWSTWPTLRAEMSVLWFHSIYQHQRRENVPYAMRVTMEHRDSLDTQVTKIVDIFTFSGAVGSS